MFASNPLKNTVFSIEIELKLLPLIVTVLPIPPKAGSNESMIDWATINDANNNIEDIYLNTIKYRYHPIKKTKNVGRDY